MSDTLTVAFVPGVSPAKWVRVWRERLQDADLVLRAIGHDDVSAALDGDVDMCFARLPVAPDLTAIPLWTETPVAAVPKDSDLARNDTLTTADLAGLTRLGEDLVPEDVDALLDLVESGVGYAVLPHSLFRAASRKELVGRPLVDVTGTRVALVWRAHDGESELIEEFIGIVRGRSVNSSRGRAEPEEAPAPAPEKKQPTPKQKPIPGGPNSRGAQLANARYKSGTRRTGGSGPKGKKRRG
ncbi:LysR family transcriptional regulator substrate-binding protein [Curtobacterium sp. Leaf261]|uniref:LysR family transcriptional regulator substrate-binding protein n=1 Tax=Curtobacterium sp. Leaf261 TaxID=1736311 RepID=UPI0006F45F7A|nr:LysR family transcriptional regulator substrate-binding protein [Curtobacterium sp. Leaf261]KQO62382.1 hypothetical protein ASF23_11430 [Curtobacterium sp. Leaf261]